MKMRENGEKIKIALVIDTENWAFANIVKNLKANLQHKYDFAVIPTEIINNIWQIFMLAEDYDIIHFFWRGNLQLIEFDDYRFYLQGLGVSYQDFYNLYLKDKIISTSVYDHLFLTPVEIDAKKNLFSNTIKGYTVCSEKLAHIYRNIDIYPNPEVVAEDGVDTSLFQPINIERLTKTENRDIVIGWAGNSKWAVELGDLKGLETILKPAISIIKEEGLRVTSCFADRQEKFTPHNEMPTYYSKIDVLVCSSKIEGTPNPVLEAMACGVPVISTDVGIVAQVFGRLQSQFIIPERNIEQMCKALRHIVAHKELLPQLSKENLVQVKEWDWSEKAKKFDYFFEKLLSKKYSGIS